MVSLFLGAEVIMHDARGCELLGVVLKFHFSFLLGALWGSGQFTNIVALLARRISHSRIHLLVMARGKNPATQVYLSRWHHVFCRGPILRTLHPVGKGIYL